MRIGTKESHFDILVTVSIALSTKGHISACPFVTSGDTQGVDDTGRGRRGGTHLVILPHVDRGGRVLCSARLAGHPLPGVVGRGEWPRRVRGGVLAWLGGELAVWSILLVSIVGLWRQRKEKFVRVSEQNLSLENQDFSPPLFCPNRFPPTKHPPH